MSHTGIIRIMLLEMLMDPGVLMSEYSQNVPPQVGYGLTYVVKCYAEVSNWKMEYSSVEMRV